MAVEKLWPSKKRGLPKFLNPPPPPPPKWFKGEKENCLNTLNLMEIEQGTRIRYERIIARFQAGELGIRIKTTGEANALLETYYPGAGSPRKEYPLALIVVDGVPYQSEIKDLPNCVWMRDIFPSDGNCLGHDIAVRARKSRYGLLCTLCHLSIRQASEPEE